MTILGFLVGVRFEENVWIFGRICVSPAPGVSGGLDGSCRKRSTKQPAKSASSRLDCQYELSFSSFSRPLGLYQMSGITSLHLRLATMAITRSFADRSKPKTPETASSQMMRNPTEISVAPSRPMSSGTFGSNPSQIATTHSSTPSAPGHSTYITRPLRNKPPSRRSTTSPTISEIENYLSMPPFAASSVQFVLWHSWTTIASPPTIARMHNRVFSSSATPKMSRWNVVDIENDIATNWYERGRSFKGLEPWSLLVAPTGQDKWSCLCDFGVQNCWDYKRDGGTLNDLERLDMARSLWDATSAELVSCTHGRRRPVGKEESRSEVEAKTEGMTASWLDLGWVKMMSVLVIAVLLAFEMEWIIP